MNRVTPNATVYREALSRLPELNLSELRQHWRALYKADASPHLSHELLVRAVAYRMQEVARGGLRPRRQRQLRQIAQQLKQTGAANIPPPRELKPGTRLVREWQGRTYDVMVLDGGFSWQETHYRSLVLEKQRDIAILKSMGFRARDIRRIFLIQGVLLGFAGSVLGLPLGAALMLGLMQIRLKISRQQRSGAVAD